MVEDEKYKKENSIGMVECEKCKHKNYISKKTKIFFGYRETFEELNHCGSDLNNLINKEFTKEMTTVNLDTIVHRRKTTHFFSIESKHIKEKLSGPHMEVLKILSILMKHCDDEGKKELRKHNVNPDRMRVLLIRGNYPYEQTDIYDYTGNNHDEQIVCFDEKLLKVMLEGEMSFDEFKEKCKVK